MEGRYNCGGTDHWKDACPLASRATSFDEHMSRTGSFVDRWVDGEISIEQKRVAISQENEQWYGPACRRVLLYP